MNNIRISDAISALGVNEWTMSDEPSSEAEFNEFFRKVTGEDENGIGILSSNPSDFGTTWSDVKAKYDEMVAAKPMADLRAERKKRLAETDWWASSDLTMSDAQKKYRTDLRNIPASGATGLDDVTWPTKPS